MTTAIKNSLVTSHYTCARCGKMSHIRRMGTASGYMYHMNCEPSADPYTLEKLRQFWDEEQIASLPELTDKDQFIEAGWRYV